MDRPLREVAVDGARLRYLDVGSGDQLVLLHGYPQSHRCWRHQIAARRLKCPRRPADMLMSALAPKLMRHRTVIDGAAPVPADFEACRQAYRAEQEPLLAERLPITAGIYVVMVGIAIGVEWMLFPDRRLAALGFYAGHLAVSAGGLLAVRMLRGRIATATIAVVVACAWSVLLAAYAILLVHNPERLGSAQICLLYGLFFMLPWRWGHQLVVALVTLAAAAIAASMAPNAEQSAYGVIVTLTATLTSVGGVVFLDRYRFDGFVRQVQLGRASREKQEEAEIAAALLHVSEVLGAHVNEPDLLVHLTQVAVETVGCDWGSTFALDEHRGIYRLASVFGEPLGVREEMEVAEFDSKNLPLVDRLRAGALIELADARDQDYVPPALLARWQVASQLIAPIAMGGRVVGALCLAHRERRGPYSLRERRLAEGIMHATALALANSTLIRDLRMANKLRSEFVSTMSHELRTPLNVILGFADIAQDDALDDRERLGMLQRIETAGRELLRLIEDTLAMGRLEAGRERVRLEAIQTATLWDQLRKECVTLPQHPAVTFEWQPTTAETAATVFYTDVRKLTIVLRNLVHNALKFTEAGWVRVALAIEDESLILSVSDTGIGIRPEDQQVVFEMFRQGDGSDTRRYGGTGLGLHIVQRFVEQLGGTIGVASALGVGSRFTVTLPLHRSLAALSNVG